MKRVLSWLSLPLLVLGLSGCPEEEPLPAVLFQLDEEPPANSLFFTMAEESAGDLLVLALEVKGVTNVFSIPVQLTFNPQLLQVVATNPATLFGATQVSDFVVANGVILGFVGTRGTSGFSGDGRVATITFRGVGAAVSSRLEIDARSNLIDNDSVIPGVTRVGGTVTPPGGSSTGGMRAF